MLRRRCQKASADKKRMNKKTASYRLRDGKNLPAVPLLLGPREKRQRGTLPRFPYDNGGTPARLKDGEKPGLLAGDSGASFGLRLSSPCTYRRLSDV